MADTPFVYSFTVWPSETWGHPPALFEIAKTMPRVEFSFTPQGFERFRSELGRSGFTMREIERVPYHEPETIQ